MLACYFRATRGKRKKASIDQETRQDADRPVNADQGSVNSVQAEAEPDLGSEDEGEDGEEYENEGGYYGNGMYDQQAEPINPWMANFQPNSASPDDPPATISEEEYNILVDLPMVRQGYNCLLDPCLCRFTFYLTRGLFGEPGATMKVPKLQAVPIHMATFTLSESSMLLKGW